MISKISAALCFCLILSCTRAPVDNNAAAVLKEPAARPLAILQTGEHPLWFQLTEGGPVHLASIEDAVFSAALIPWPLALHVRFFYEKESEIVMAVNRDGFLKITPDGLAEGLALYRFFGGDLWRQYTIGGFVYFDEEPVVLLYNDDRFLDSGAPVLRSATWTFNMKSNTPFPLSVPALEIFPAREGWEANALRLGSDGLIYYRVINKRGSETGGQSTTGAYFSPVIRTLRTDDLAQAGEDIPLEDFFHYAMRNEMARFDALPELPENFYYTGFGSAGDSLFAAWEEQVDYSIGAAGFVLIRK